MKGGVSLYEKPKLERFGTFRQLTQSGGGSVCDNYIVGVACTTGS